MKILLIKLVLCPLLFFITAQSGVHLLQYCGMMRAWNSQAAAWFGPPPNGLQHHPHRHGSTHFNPEYFTFRPTENQLQNFCRNLQLVPSSYPASPAADIRHCLQLEGGTPNLQQLYSRNSPLIIQSDIKEYSVTCTPWLALLKDGRAIYCTQGDILGNHLDKLTPPTYPELAYHGAGEWQPTAEAALLTLLLILPALLCIWPIPHGLAAQCCNYLLLPTICSLLWLYILPEPNEDNIHASAVAVMLNFPCGLTFLLAPRILRRSRFSPR